MNRLFSKKAYYLLVFQFLFFVGQGFAQDQEVEVSGTVTDAQEAPIPGVTVSVSGKDALTATDADGKYTAVVPAGATLAFSFVGYKTQEIEVGNQQVINVTLEEDLASLDEVVVIGYGAQKRVNVVGAVASVSGQDIESIPASDITNAISGRLAGATVQQPSGEPGNNDADIRVRGRTTLGNGTGPLIVIDGIPGRVLSEVDPVDIESISILKDASSAIYGTQAANGVILVTTKKGQSGKPRLNYQFYQGFMTPTKLPEVLNAGDYATMLSEYQDYEGMPRTFTDRDIGLFYSGEDPWEHPNTNWMGELVADWTTTSKHNITVDGGNNGMYYYLSLGYRNEEAIYKQESTRYRQYNMRAKLEMPITDWLTAGVDYAGYIPSRYYPTNSAAEIYGQSTRLLPTQWSFWPSGEPGPDLEYGHNPVVTSTLEGGYNDNKQYKNEMAFKVAIEPPMIEGLSINGLFSYDVYNRYQKIFRTPWTLYFPDWSSAQRDADGFITSMEVVPTLRGYSSPELQENHDRYIRQMGNVSFTYAREFDDHSFSIFGAYEQMQENSNNFGAFRRGYISDIVQTIDAGSDTDKDNSGSMSIYSRKSWIGRLNYSYRSKYLVELLFRRDGSLKFPPDSRWGNFPAILLGWQASEEPFWKEHIGVFNYFKLRATYGKMGMDPGAAFQYMNKYNLATGVAMGGGKDIEVVVRQAGIANPFITWEKQTTYNIGFDSYLLNDKFHLNTEFFYNKRSDILAPRNASVPEFTGLQLPDENIAEVDNRGFEIDLGYHQQVNQHFRLDIGGNVSWSRNKVVFTDEPKRAVPWQQRTGHPFGATLLYNAIGIFADQAALDAYPHWSGAKPGDIIFEDVSGDGKINSDDKILLDKTDAPELLYGISLDLRYKNWSLSLLAQGQGTYYQLNSGDARRGEAGNYFQWSFDNRWTPGNPNTDVARPYNRGDEYWAFDVNNSTYWFDSMAYLRLKNAVLTYDLPKNLFGNSGISRASIYVAGNNLFLIYSAQDNFDPEIAAPLIYPAVKTFAIGAKVTF